MPPIIQTDPNNPNQKLMLFIVQLLFAILMPPISVLLSRGCDFHLILNIILTILGFVPGIIHAVKFYCQILLKERSQSPPTNQPIMPFTCSDICKIILAVILPPLGVLAEKGCGVDLLINIALTILGFIPGIIHALYIIFKY
ncbi:plasma membrane proteolipid Pmp3 [Blomia tropicalis]|nr:plasma membrane proteolipid Pmp3 [Blomia tropicalis]